MTDGSIHLLRQDSGGVYMVVRSGMLSGGWGPTAVVRMVLWYQGNVLDSAGALVYHRVVSVSSPIERIVLMIGIFFFYS